MEGAPHLPWDGLPQFCTALSHRHLNVHASLPSASARCAVWRAKLLRAKTPIPAAAALPGGAEAALTAPHWVPYPNPTPGPTDVLGMPTGETARNETPTCRDENPHRNVPAEPAGMNVYPADTAHIPRQLMEGQMLAQVVAMHMLINNANLRILTQVLDSTLEDPHNHLFFIADNGGRVYRKRIPDETAPYQSTAI
ncbi:hypothetical protein C8R46DRAFT_1042398 [Mycena filopes]|nr:hypothetical protein C8R46DRAFT_1042398 [Mycena filopes]